MRTRLISLITLAILGLWLIELVSQPQQATWLRADERTGIRALTVLPSTCAVGDLVILTTGTTGLYTCVTANTWTPPPAGGAGAGLTRINGSSGAAGAELTWQQLSANCAANATTTLATCMTTTGVGAGTWRFRYAVIYQAAATTTGVDFAVNHTGTVTRFVASSWLTTSGGSAATALADQVASNTANLVEGKAARAINTKFGSTLGVDTASADMLVIIEGTIVVSVSGSLELKHASELAASTQVMADTVLELHKIN